MSHGKIRADKTCLNCGHLVEERFCPHCGQENTETKQPFHYLFTHFIEDFTHYDGQFWKTIRYLLLNPGRLTKEYLTGKRQTYVAPVKLYIFISFITFLLPSLFSGSEEYDDKQNKKEITAKELKEKQTEEKITKFTDSLALQLKSKNIKNQKPETYKDAKITEVNGNDIETDALSETNDGKMSVLGATNMKQFDSLYAKKVSDRRVFDFLRPFASKVFHLQDQGLGKEEILNRFSETFIHTLPKALFVYLPIFAFFLWIFHNKKKWWYFDHGIFTLHYFSFLLLGILILIFFNRFLDMIPDNIFVSVLQILAYMGGVIYIFIYFFIAHHRVYESSRGISLLKGFLLLIINFIGIMCMLLLLMYISFMMMH
ncbi:Protein of unknown function [Chryseobacterium taichungense]|uniref:DUF3667 domain-containing protein n=1 Tax=Chryseobacterium taichungense TaxID=295069 RepID=A0A1H7WH02_9FLAO|nr:DUF3667 domain-containing protein [Chryseobacterium taichungense]SEM20882.1 Protein of unknown function [Chryseobacterium taichungense]